MLKTNEWIVTSADLQADADTVLRNAQKRPLIITAEGRPKAYVLGVALFDALVERLQEIELEEMTSNIAKGEQQFANGDFLALKDAAAMAEAKWKAQEMSG